jgi:hypothetical protein
MAYTCKACTKYQRLVAQGRHYSTTEDEITLGSQNNSSSEDSSSSQVSNEDGLEYTTANSVSLGEQDTGPEQQMPGGTGQTTESEEEDAGAVEVSAGAVEVPAVEVPAVEVPRKPSERKPVVSSRRKSGRCRVGCGVCLRAKVPLQSKPYFKQMRRLNGEQ